ncbi:MAG TPA: DUF1501 domain-containing protein [Candidatus Methylomirabilis sp.]|nr:DUF1501 domain-containing protein [Candidatus Methylomirabilis sp.]
MHRRSVVKLGLAGAAHTLLGSSRLVSRVFAASGPTDTKFLLVFLRGGYDAANVVIPVGSHFYYEARPTLAVPRPDPSNPLAALPLARPGETAEWGLHPALKDSIYPLWQHGQAAFVPFAGSRDMTRSHFETQDSIEEGLPLPVEGPGPRAPRSGFMNRLAAVLGDRAAPVAFTDDLPMTMTGDVLVPNVSLKGTGRAPFDDRQMALLASLYAGTRFESLVNEGFELRRTVAQQAEMMASGNTSSEMQAANRRALSAHGFELEARRMAGLLQDKFNLAFIDVGGWDTHVNEGSAQGQLANLLGDLGKGLAGFAEQMGKAWSSTVVVVISEFGRTFRENGTRGTDHGHGTVYWVLGGGIRGGRMAGSQVAVERRTLNQDRDWPVLTEYRTMLGGLFKRAYGLDDSALERVFPSTSPSDIGLI